jgi:hypothetical protein
VYREEDRNVLRLHVARSGILFILFARLNRVRRGQLERCWRVVVVTPASVGRQDNVASANGGLPTKWVSKPPDERSTCVEIKSSQILQLGIAESWLMTFDRAPLGRWSRVSRRDTTTGCEMDPHIREARHWRKVEEPPTRRSLRLGLRIC